MYVGKANEPQDRWWEHKNHARNGSMYAVHCAIRKHGPDSFLFYIVNSYGTEQEAYDAEVEYIKKYKTTVDEWGYNMTKGGEGFSLTESVRKRHKEIVSSPEHREKLKAAQKIVWDNPKHREKQLAVLIAGRRTPEARAKQSEIAKELWQRPESTAPILASLQELINDPERLAARNKAISDAYKTPEGRANKSAAMTKLWEDPEYRESLTAKRQEIRRRPEVRQMQAEITRKRWDTPERRDRDNRIIQMLDEGISGTRIASIIGCNKCVIYRISKKLKKDRSEKN